MSTEVRFLLAIGLMLAVLVGTNLLFPPVEQEPVPGAGPDTGAVATEPAPGAEADRGAREGAAAGPDTSGEALQIPEQDEAVDELAGDVGGSETEGPGGETTATPAEPETLVEVRSPLYRYTFSSRGARLVGAELPRFRSMAVEDGEESPVSLIPEGSRGALGHRLVVGSDTLDLRDLSFRAEPAEGFELTEGAEPRELRFVYDHPTSDFRVELTYTFRPDAYLTPVQGRIEGLSRALVLTDMGSGIPFNESDREAERRMMAWVGNHLEEGITSHELVDVEEPSLEDGPFLWAAFKSKFFVLAVLPHREEGGDDYLGGILVDPVPADAGPEPRARVSVSQNLGSDQLFDYQVFAGPLEYSRLTALGDDLEEVNPYGWRFFRPIIRPFVSVIMTVLNYLHDTLSLGYGWVLMLFGVLMRVLLWPLNQKAMKAQLNNMQVQPLLKEIQEKHKDNPEKLQQEMMKLYKEYGFNPLAGCWPMLLPWPILIALFFVFQNTVELRGVSFLWLPDLSAPDPFYILPLILAVSMFGLQYISYRSMDGDNTQMKMMMYFMPLFMGFIFMQFASGLNLYYATANVATLPQQFWIAKERKKAQARGPIKRDGD